MSQSNKYTTGRAYGRSQASADMALAQCGRGTPGGELLRRYWHPISLSDEVDLLPKPVKVLGEDLVLFRDGSGKVGLLYARCLHRGTSLVYGKVEQDGIRCCYHGWKFDTQGNCLDTPCEPANLVRERLGQPWYPVIEQYGLIFAYMGPADRQPVFPDFGLENDLRPGERLVGAQRKSGPNTPHPKLAARTDYNWWQAFDNFTDPFHVVVMHYLINGAQFVESLGILPKVRFEYTPDGVRSIQHRVLPDGSLHQRISQVILPNIHCTPGITDEDLGRAHIGWIVPSDDTSYLHFVLTRVSENGSPFDFVSRIGMMKDDWGPSHGRPFVEWSLEDNQHWQTDYIAQKGQGDISLHSEEHLSSTDAGISMMRRLFRNQSEVVSQGGDPIGASIDVAYRLAVTAGNALLDPTTMRCVAGFDGR
jgi:nitrite reductase/ring-hydroxylating ferredoxin subunit